MAQLLAQATVNGMSSGVFYVLIALGFTLIFGIQRIINFAHGEFYAIGGYLLYVFAMYLGLPMLIATLASVIGSMLIGGLIEIVVIERIKDNLLNSFIGTLGLSLVLSSLLLIIFGATELPRMPVIGSGETYNLGFILLPRSKAYIIAISIIIIAFFMWFINKTWYGRALRAIAMDSEMALAQGINVRNVTILGFMIGCGLPAFAGTLLGPLYVIYPYSGQSALLKSFIVVILGGLGSIPGAIVGGMLIGLLEAYASVFMSLAFGNLIGFLAIIIILLLRPQGLLGVSIRRY